MLELRVNADSQKKVRDQKSIFDAAEIVQLILEHHEFDGVWTLCPDKQIR